MVGIFNSMITKTYTRRGIDEIVTFFCDILVNLSPLLIERGIEVPKGYVCRRFSFFLDESRIKCDLLRILIDGILSK